MTRSARTSTTATPVSREHVSSELEGVAGILGELVVGLPHEAGISVIRTSVGVNSAERFRNDVFAVRDYCWCDGLIHAETEEGLPNCPPNFEHFASGITGEWYKYLGRDTRWSRYVSGAEALAILGDCIRSLPNQDLAKLMLPQEDTLRGWGWQKDQSRR